MVQASTKSTRGLAAFALLAAIVVSGCAADAPGVASLDDDGRDGATTEPDAGRQEGDPVKFAECMRDQGIEIEDPEFGDGGQFAITIPEGTQREDADDAMKAMQACKEFMPNGGEPPQLDPEQQAKMREFAECMRRNGIEEFPDPGPGGGLEINGDEDAFDPMSQEFKAAQDACRDELPVAPGGPGAGPNSSPGGN